MTLDEATELAKRGAAIRCGGMSEGWAYVWLEAAGQREAGLWARNPRTGSLLGFPPDKDRTDWSALPTQGAGQ